MPLVLMIYPGIPFIKTKRAHLQNIKAISNEMAFIGEEKKISDNLFFLIML